MTAKTVRYRYRIRPGSKAERALEAEWDRCRWLWNQMVQQRAEGQHLTRSRLCYLLTDARRRLSWLREGSQSAQEFVGTDFLAALNLSKTVPGHRGPKFKKKALTNPSLTYRRHALSITADRRLRLSKVGTIPVVWTRNLPSPPSSVRVFRDSLGHWYASFVVVTTSDLPAATGRSIGIDWGVSTTATASDASYDLPYSPRRRQCAAALAKAQRKMARRRRPGVPASNGYKRARREAAKIYAKARRQTQHDARQWAHRVVAEHDLIAVEDFRPKFLAKSTLARKAADSAIAATKRELVEHAKRAGRTVVMVRPAYTTMTCSSCFARATQRLELGQRTFVCTTCGLVDDRDRNAARVILAVAKQDHASVDEVGPVRDGLSELGSSKLERC